MTSSPFQRRSNSLGSCAMIDTAGIVIGTMCSACLDKLFVAVLCYPIEARERLHGEEQGWR
jgi:hypothetical protein